MLDVVQRPVRFALTGLGVSSLQLLDMLKKDNTSSHRIDEGHKKMKLDSEIIQQH